MTGIVCPKCRSSADTTVTDSRPHASGRSRRHRCVCGHRFSSVEVVISEKPRLLVGLNLKDASRDKADIIAKFARFLADTL